MGFFGVYFLGLLGWQGYETNKLLAAAPDWNGDGQTTISDIWSAWVFVWETPARSVLAALGPEMLRFFELAAAPQWLLVIVSLLSWTVIAVAPSIAIAVLAEMAYAVFGKKDV